MQKLLELKGVSRRVSNHFSLRDVTLAVEPGQIVGFVGANGAGKTTTIRAALGLIKPDAGEVLTFDAQPSQPPQRGQAPLWWFLFKRRR